MGMYPRPLGQSSERGQRLLFKDSSLNEPVTLTVTFFEGTEDFPEEVAFELVLEGK